jgi:hypothetical protein
MSLYPVHAAAVHPLNNLPTLRTTTPANDVQQRMQEISASPVAKPSPTFEFNVDLIETIKRIKGISEWGFYTVQVSHNLGIYFKMFICSLPVKLYHDPHCMF